MAKKEFVFHGKKREELKALSLDEFLTMIPSRQRRSIQRMLAAKSDDERIKLYKRIQNYKGGKIRTHCRDFVILPEMIDMTISVYNGREFKDIYVNEKMLGHILGEFVLTRAFLTHSSPGIGASKSTKFVSVRA